MNTRHIMLLLVLVPQLLLGGNVDVTMGTEHILKFSRISDSGVQDVGLWRQTMVSTQLVGRFIVEGDTIVSVLPTPISSDTHRPRAHFIEFGTGWELINKLFVDDQGRIWENGPGTNRTDIAPSKLSDHKFLALISDNPLILLSVQQGAPFSVVSEILRTISERNASVGLGWNPAHE